MWLSLRTEQKSREEMPKPWTLHWDKSCLPPGGKRELRVFPLEAKALRSRGCLNVMSEREKLVDSLFLFCTSWTFETLQQMLKNNSSGKQMGTEPGLSEIRFWDQSSKAVCLTLQGLTINATQQPYIPRKNGKPVSDAFNIWWDCNKFMEKIFKTTHSNLHALGQELWNLPLKRKGKYDSVWNN